MQIFPLLVTVLQVLRIPSRYPFNSFIERKVIFMNGSLFLDIFLMCMFFYPLLFSIFNMTDFVHTYRKSAATCNAFFVLSLEFQ